ncbi:hybrid sensor histidine kinase/response regulator [Calothrix membranacea FACHB-236]|nr:hybrid sensor histidine kinase/response regulator [Calothrix membranacea FACHB-236]
MIKILVIEDEESIRENVQELLEMKNFEAITAENGVIGVQKIKEQIPDLILCDVMMPELDGYGVLRFLQQNVATAHIPLIFLTAKADKLDLRQGMELGADDYLTKPFTSKQLLKAIAIRLEKQDAINRQSQKQIEELRSNITLSLPHELHTSLNGIIGLSELLIEDYNSMDKGEVLEMLELINISGKRLYRLTQNFLLYAELELLAKNPEEIKALRNELHQSDSQKIITEIALEKAQQSGREADLHLDLQDIRVKISEPNLKRIVIEIIDNAFKFSPPGTPVHIISKLNGDNFNLDVIDCGRGISSDEIAALGAYMQFGRKLYAQEGLGLGLIIAKKCVEIYGGELKINTIPGKHTIVSFTLP